MSLWPPVDHYDWTDNTAPFKVMSRCHAIKRLTTAYGPRKRQMWTHCGSKPVAARAKTWDGHSQVRLKPNMQCALEVSDCSHCYSSDSRAWGIVYLSSKTASRDSCHKSRDTQLWSPGIYRGLSVSITMSTNRSLSGAWYSKYSVQNVASWSRVRETLWVGDVSVEFGTVRRKVPSTWIDSAGPRICWSRSARVGLVENILLASNIVHWKNVGKHSSTNNYSRWKKALKSLRWSIASSHTVIVGHWRYEVSKQSSTWAASPRERENQPSKTITHSSMSPGTPSFFPVETSCWHQPRPKTSGWRFCAKAMPLAVQHILAAKAVTVILPLTPFERYRVMRGGRKGKRRGESIQDSVRWTNNCVRPWNYVWVHTVTTLEEYSHRRMINWAFFDFWHMQII